MEIKQRKRKRPDEEEQEQEQEQEEASPSLLLPLSWFQQHRDELKDFKLDDDEYFVNREVWRFDQSDPWTLSMCYRKVWPDRQPLRWESEVYIPERMKLAAPLCMAVFNRDQARQLRRSFSDVDAANSQVREKLKSTGTKMIWDRYFSQN